MWKRAVTCKETLSLDLLLPSPALLSFSHPSCFTPTEIKTFWLLQLCKGRKETRTPETDFYQVFFISPFPNYSTLLIIGILCCCCISSSESQVFHVDIIVRLLLGAFGLHCNKVNILEAFEESKWPINPPISPQARFYDYFAASSRFIAKHRYFHK